jgi:Spy/CpxP family protein refolding chaperone
MKILACFVIVALASVGSLAAQAHQHQEQEHARQMEHQDQGVRMGGMHSFQLSMLLEHHDELELTDDQVAQLTALEEATKQAVDEAHQPAQAAMQNLHNELMSENPNPESVRTFFTAHHTAMGNMQWIQLESVLEAMALLTPEQLATIKKAVQEHGGGMQHRER